MGLVYHESLLNDLCRRLGNRNIDLGRIMEDLPGHFPDLTRHGGGEKQVLALGWQEGNDLHDIVEEAHVQHAIGLVQHKVL